MFLVGLGVFLIRLFNIFDVDRIRAFVQAAGPWGPLALIAFITIGSVSFTIPSTPAIVLSGILYGPVLGGLFAFIGIMTAASVAFFISRLFRERIIRMLGSHAKLLVLFQEKSVAYVVGITRAIPFFYFEVVSYAAGLTSISYHSYIIATAIGILVPITLFTTSGQVFSSSGPWSVIAAMFVALALFIVPIAIDHYNPWGWKQKLLRKEE
jgi:uncharacterized membrane protein YdjX (TVP38/TMEM64 family)